MTTTSRPGRSASSWGSRSSPLSCAQPQVEEGEVEGLGAERLQRRRAVAACATRHPSPSRHTASVARMFFSSSTTRTRNGDEVTSGEAGMPL